MHQDANFTGETYFLHIVCVNGMPKYFYQVKQINASLLNYFLTGNLIF
jgi:hypothetical protein